MAVYVDDMKAQFGRMVMCHMIADTTQELLDVVDKIGVQRKWIQNPGTYREHFDISLSKRALAIRHGAVQITWRQAAAMTSRLFATGSLGDPLTAEQWLQDKIREEREGRHDS